MLNNPNCDAIKPHFALGGSSLSEAGVFRAAHFLVIKVIHDDRMPRLCPAVGEFVVHKGTIIFSRKALCPLLQLPEIAPVSSGIDGVVQRHEVRVFLLNIGQDVFFEAAPQIQIFQPHQVALAFHPVEDGLEIRDTGKNRSDKAHGADACIIAAGVDLGAVQDGLHGAVHDLGRGGAVGVDEVISAFDSKVKTAYQSVLNRMVGFVNDFLDMSETVHKDVNLIRAIVDLVQQDQTIKAGDEFFIGQNGEKKKKATLGDLKEVCLPSFLLGVWHFIVVNRKDNGIGKATYDVWCPSAGGGQRKYVAHMGEGILESLTISYADIVEEAETDAEPVETVIIEGTSEQQVQQTVNNPFVFNFNQYGNNGTQIGHIENYYGSKKKED